MVRRTASSQFLAIATLVVLAAAAHAQTATRAVVRVSARDSSGVAVQNAELTLVRGLRDVVARGTTDDEGQGTLIIPDVKDSTDYQVVMRRIGYARTERFFSVGPRDTAKIELVVAHPTATLATVKVTAEGSVLRKSYYLDADDIASSDWHFINGWDVLKRLRPDMLTSRGGCETGAQEIWVNGKRIRLPLMPTGMARATALVGVPSRARFTYTPVSVLSEIEPEHIESITYKDCFDHSMAVVGTTNAVFVVLKPGVVYQVNVGSFVVETADNSGKSVIR
jgi:hypothetical protein